MANQKCPNCNHFTYSQGLSSRADGFFLIIGAFIAPILGSLAFQSRGGYDDSTSSDTWTTVFFILSILGLVIFISPINLFEQLKGKEKSSHFFC